MSLLSFFSSRELALRGFIALIDTMNDQMDEKHEREELAKWLDEQFNLPLYDDDEELEKFRILVHEAWQLLEKFEGLLRRFK